MSGVRAPGLERGRGGGARGTWLGRIQRGGAPGASARGRATRRGPRAAGARGEGAGGEVVALQGAEIGGVTVEGGSGGLREVPLSRYEEASALFG